MAMLKFPHIDTEAMLDAMRDLSRDIDTSRLVALRDDISKLELPRAEDLRRGLDRLDMPDISKLELPRAEDLRRELDRLDLPDLGRLLGRPARKAAFTLPVMTPAVVLGGVMLLAGAALGGVLAWLYQPGVGVQRRKGVRRRLRKLQRMVQHSG